MSMKKIILGLLAGLLVSTGFAFAEETLPSTASGTTPIKQELKDTRAEVRDRVQEGVKALKENVQQNKTQLKDTLKTQRTDVREKIGIERDAFKEESRTKLEQFRTATAEQKQGILQDLKTKREELQTNAATLKQELRDNAEQLRTEFREKVKDARERARIAIAHHRSILMTTRFRAAIARLGNIIERIESRIQTLQGQGVDTSSVTPLVEEAKNLKAQAEATLESLKAKYESLLSGNDPKQILEEAKVLVADIKSQLEALRAKLREIVAALKALAPQPAVPATSATDEQTP